MMAPVKSKPSDERVLMALALEKQRLCYWLIRMIHASGWTGEVEEGALQCLIDVGYHPRSQLARNLIEHGEPRGVKNEVRKGARMACDTNKCAAAAAWTVYWPGQTSHKCDPCKTQAEQIARAMGFDLDSDPFPSPTPGSPSSKTKETN